MTKFYFFLILFLGVNIGVSWSADYHRTIQWNQKNLDENSPGKWGFEGSVRVDGQNLPCWFESFQVTSANVDVRILNPVFEPMSTSQPEPFDLVQPELQYQAEVKNSAGQHFLSLTICPFIKRNNQVERLVEFTVSVSGRQSSLKSAQAAYTWKSSSVLSSGTWVKISTKSKGIFKITFDQLKQWGFGNPDQVAMYGNGGYLLPVLNKDNSFDDLNRYPVWKGKDNAGKDCLFFFSTGNIKVTYDAKTGKFSHRQNPYSTESFFYLTDLGNALLIGKAGEISEVADTMIVSFPNYVYNEKELSNLIASGSRWFGERFLAGSSQTISLNLENANLALPVTFKVSAAAKSSSASSLVLTVNGTKVSTASFSAVNISDPTGNYADDAETENSVSVSDASIAAKLTYNASNSSSEAWLDYISASYQSFLKMTSDVYFFRGKGADARSSVSEFVLDGASASTKIIDITDFDNFMEMPAGFADGKLRFKSSEPIVREYVAFNPAGNIPVPDFVENVANQNLHATAPSEMIIVSNAKLMSAANELADFHRTNDGMSVQVVAPEAIYNEFSGGLPDPAGIRNYFRMYYDRGNQDGKPVLKYVLLMGDGSYDNRNILGKKFNLLPTYQSDESLSATRSFVTDDFFVFLDENEGGSLGAVDLGIGRIPANTLQDAEAVIGKIKHYHDAETLGTWRNMVTFIADDGNLADGFSNTHASQAELLANFVNSNYPSFYTDKIYFDSYKKITSAGGEKYPDVVTTISNRVKQGTLIMNYTGHANERNLADEGVLDITTIDSWSNFNKLPLFVTATCEYSRYDADETTAGEHILFNPAGGGVGLFSTTRLVYSGANSVLNRKFFLYIFQKDEFGNNLRLGDVMRLAKASANTDTNQLNFSLLADPALRLADPEYQVKTTSMNGKDVAITTDTIGALSAVTVKGIIADNSGARLSSFNGEIIPTVYDKAMRVLTLGNSGQSPIAYTVQNNVIYKGLASVKNGEFEFSFVVPKDISFKLDAGKILYYAYNETTDATGFFNNFLIGGSTDNTISDLNGPQIDLYMNSRSFVDGGTVSASSVLLADIRDESGINTAGTGIGHDITAVLDGDNANLMVLNDYFQADKDSYTSGKIVFPVNNLAEGEHTLRLKVWDVVNNSSEVEIRFVVKDEFKIENVHCYPNPMQGETKFVFTHNQPDESFDLTLEVFEASGARVDMLQTRLGSLGTESLPLEWIPGNRKVKMKPGVYIYRLTASAGGKTASGSGRLVFVYR